MNPTNPVSRKVPENIAHLVGDDPNPAVPVSPMPMPQAPAPDMASLIAQTGARATDRRFTYNGAELTATPINPATGLPYASVDPVTLAPIPQPPPATRPVTRGLMEPNPEAQRRYMEQFSATSEMVRSAPEEAANGPFPSHHTGSVIQDPRAVVDAFAPPTPYQVANECRESAKSMDTEALAADSRSPISGHSEPKYLYASVAANLRKAAGMVEVMEGQLHSAHITIDQLIGENREARAECARARAQIEESKTKTPKEGESCQVGTVGQTDSKPSKSSAPPKPSGPVT